jgi:hypothetical protein
MKTYVIKFYIEKFYGLDEKKSINTSDNFNYSIKGELFNKEIKTSVK